MARRARLDGAVVTHDRHMCITNADTDPAGFLRSLIIEPTRDCRPQKP